MKRQLYELYDLYRRYGINRRALRTATALTDT